MQIMNKAIAGNKNTGKKDGHVTSIYYVLTHTAYSI